MPLLARRDDDDAVAQSGIHLLLSPFTPMNSRHSQCAIARHAASFSANGRVYAGLDDGSTSVAYPASRHAALATRGLAVEADRAQPARDAAHAGDLAALGVANRAVEAAPRSQATIVSQIADAARAHACEPLVVGKIGERLAEHRAEERPEVVARMRVVLPRGERRLARKTAEDQHARVAREHRRQAASRRLRRVAGAARAALRGAASAPGVRLRAAAAHHARGQRRRRARSRARCRRTRRDRASGCRGTRGSSVAVAVADEPQVVDRDADGESEPGVVRRPQRMDATDHAMRPR